MDDLISRQSVLKAINDMVKECDSVYVTSALRNLEVIVADVPPAQPKRTEERTETHACDLISRQAAIDYCYQLINVEHQQGSDEMNYGQERVNQTETILQHLEIMPSAQPETHEKRTETHACDLISRQAAIAEIARWIGYIDEDMIGRIQIGLKKLPSAQPEQLTDKEQRIFLAAMGREEKVCKQVDDECRNCREPYEDSLVRTCHEITRKVKGALWMI